MKNNETFLIIFSILGGLFSIAASIFDWDFFFESRKAQFFMSIFGRKGSRIFYFILGLFLIFVAIMIYTK